MALMFVATSAPQAGGPIDESISSGRSMKALDTVSFDEVARLLPSDGHAGDRFGAAVAISGDTVVVGAEYFDGNSGAAYVFEKPPDGWSGTLTEAARLVPSDNLMGSQFGVSVAISGDAAFVGAFLGDGLVADTGAVYVFERPLNGWTGTVNESAKLVAGDGTAYDCLGISVAVSGNTVIVGSYDDANGLLSGAAYAFVEPALGWSGLVTESARLEPSDAMPLAYFGCSVALDGSTAVVGAHGGDGSSGDPGAAYVFEEPVGGWSGTVNQTATLLASDGNLADWYGFAVSIAIDTVLVGSPESTAGAIGSGSAYVFEKPPEGWSGTLNENAKLVAAAPTATDFLGRSVGVSGGVLLVGATHHFPGSTVPGSVRVYAEPAGGWNGVVPEESILQASDGQLEDGFGCSLALTDSLTVIGAANPLGGSTPSGSAFIFESNFLFIDGFESGDTSAWSATVP